MGLFDRFQGDDSEPKAPLDHFELMHSQDGGTFRQADVPTDLDVDLTDVPIEQPLSEEGVKETAEVEGWPPGYYALKERREDNTYGAIKWKFQHEGDGSDPEPTTEEQMLMEMREMREEMRDGGVGGIGQQIIEKALDAAEPEDVLGAVDFGKVVDRELAADDQRPENPGEFAAMLTSMYLHDGNTRAASAILDRWFQSQQTTGEQASSLLDLVDAGEVELDMDAVKTLGFLKFLDNPREMIAEGTRGLMDGATQPGGGAAGGQDGGRGGLDNLGELLASQQAADEADDVDEAGADTAEPEIEPNDVADVEAAEPADDRDPADEFGETGGDFDLAPGVGEADQEPAAAEPGVPETHSEAAVGPDVADVIESGTEPAADETAESTPESHTATCGDCGRSFTRDSEAAAQRALNGHKSNCPGEADDVDATRRELERQADEEGPIPAEKALADLSGDDDGEEVAADGGGEA